MDYNTRMKYVRNLDLNPENLQKQTKAQLLQHFREMEDIRSSYNIMNKTELINTLIQKVNNMIKNDDVIKKRSAEKEAVESAHRVTRVLELRQQTIDLDPGLMEYPYSYIHSGDYDVTPDDIPGEPQEDVGDFPNNIEHYYWIHGGENDEEPWMTLCRLTNGVYVFYKGECDYTGFDCQGSMELYASKNPATLINMAMTITDYEDYFKDTSN